MKLGDVGPKVKAWQEFLRGAGLFFDECDGNFDEATAGATRMFQIGLNSDLFSSRPDAPVMVDGVVGNQTLGAAMLLGFEVEPVELQSNDWPRPDPAGWLSYNKREQVFGKIKVVPAPVAGMPEAVKIVNGWQRDNLVVATIPQIKELAKLHPGKGWNPNGEIICHKLMAEPWNELFGKLEDVGCLEDLETCDGFWVARYVRGSRSLLSNHTWGTAGDFNFFWNQQRRRPALLGQRGCMRRVAGVAIELGWHWGGNGWGPGTALDGMHLEPGMKLVKRL